MIQTEPGVAGQEPVLSVPRILVSKTSEGAGASTFVLGLLVALKRDGLAVGVAKIGPSLLDTSHFRRIGGRLAHTLDPWMLSREQMKDSLLRMAVGTEIVMLQGQSGLFDKYPKDSSYQSDADVALGIGAPVILIVDAKGYGESIAALVEGFMHYREDFRPRAIIANRVTGSAQALVVRRAVETLRGPVYLGSIPYSESLGATAAAFASGIDEASSLTMNRLITLGNLVSQSVDLSAVREIAGSARPFALEEMVRSGRERDCVVAVADDQAFHLIVQDNLDLMRRAGAELVPFSPLSDRRLPEADALYLPGGNIRRHARELQGNTAMCSLIREFAQSGRPIYAEGSAVVYLSRRAVLASGDSYDFVGVIPGTATAAGDQTSQQPVYCSVVSERDTVLSSSSWQFRGIWERCWALRLEGRVPWSFGVRRFSEDKENGKAVDPPLMDGFSPLPNVLASFVQIHWGSEKRIAEAFLSSARRAK